MCLLFYLIAASACLFSVEATCNAKVDLVFILDSSTSVGGDNYNKMLGFCKDFLSNVGIDSGSARVGIVSYSTDVVVEFTMDRYMSKQDVFDAIDKIPYRYGSTNTADGLKTTRTQLYTKANGDRPEVPDVVIILMDGVSNINSRRTIPEAENLRARGVHIYSLGIGLRDTRELDAIATPPAALNSFNVQNFDELSTLSDRVLQAFCTVLGDFTTDYIYVEEFKGFIKFHMNPVPWYEAKKICTEENGNLVTIDNARKSAAIISRSPPRKKVVEGETGFWIAANDRQQENVFVWADGTPLNYSNWSPTDPNSESLDTGFSYDVDCVLVAMWGGNTHGQWYDRKCSYPLPFICEAHSKDCPGSCYTYMEEFGMCVKLHAIPKPWQQAKEQCEERKGHLIVVDSLEKQEAITNKIKNLRMLWWIGGSSIRNKGSFKWTNGNEFDTSYTNWGPNEPDGAGMCIAMNYTSNTKGHLNDIHCGSPLNYICETPPIL